MTFIFTGIFFLILTILIILIKRRKEKLSSFFVIGLGLSWPVIGFSIIAANISTEHFIGMAGSGYKIGLAVASHEWTAAIALVVISIYIIPKYMSVGVKTIPEYLEYRFNPWMRLIVAIASIIFTIFVQFSSVLYAGALAISTIFEIDEFTVTITLCILAGAFVLIGGLSSVVRSNIIFAITFLLGGCIVLFKGLYDVGGIAGFIEKSEDKLISLLPLNDPYIPWTTALLGGLWVAQFYYFGFNQFITQYLLSGKTLSEAQKGVLFAATLKLIIPFLAIFPGIFAFEIFGDKILNPDLAFPKLVEFWSINSPSIKIIIFCTLLAAVLSSLNSMLIASANIFTQDIYFRFFNKNQTVSLVTKTGRISTLTFMLLGSMWAPMLHTFNGMFEYMQKFAGMVSPGILCIFLLAMFTKRIPSSVAICTLFLNIPIYWFYLKIFPNVPFYDIMGITFLTLLLLSLIVGRFFSLKEDIVMPENASIKFERNLLVVIWSIFLITSILFLYVLFLP